MSKCQQYDKMFRDAEVHVSDDLVTKKFILGKNAYWGRVPDKGMFPEHAGTQIKKIGISRIGFGAMERGWVDVVVQGCSSNACATPPAEVIQRGTTDFFYGLQKFRVATDPICLPDLYFRQMPEAELANFEENLKIMSRYFWDEYLRSRYIHYCQNKFVAMVSDNVFSSEGNDTCDTLESGCSPQIEQLDGFMFWNRGDTGPVLDPTLPLDERFVSVKVPVDKIRNISEMSADLAEIASTTLEFENGDLIDEGLGLMDIVVPDIKVGRRMAQLERQQESQCLPNVMYPGKDLSRSLGIQYIIRENFGIRRDLHGMKFYPDNVYNATLDPFDPTAPETWPRFRRVLAYVQGVNPNGSANYSLNPYFINAPFGITTIFSRAVMGTRLHPEAKNYGTAKKGDLARNYAGQARWINKYDKQCNPNEEIGHWELNFGAGIEPDRPEMGYAYFHRINHMISLAGVRCSVPILGVGDFGATTDCFESVQTGEAALGVTAGSRGANIPIAINNETFYI